MSDCKPGNRYAKPKYAKANRLIPWCDGHDREIAECIRALEEEIAELLDHLRHANYRNHKSTVNCDTCAMIEAALARDGGKAK